ncbi:MAG TPA: metalloregulator ArsR/SmtB family transcription factor [Candidatus Limnocylindrales bacterium]|nr:metalloregulator ArsR/SmtB family transcription factor [Candidatus Limnocylindrales bacterium]
MPVLSESSDNAIRVAPSAPLELMWVMHFATAGHEHEGAYASLDPLRARFGTRLTELRGDGMPQYSTELVVLADRSGTLLDLDLRRFFARVEDAIADPSPAPSLRSESPEELNVTRQRLERLRNDPQLRKRFIVLLGELWAAVEEEWEELGRPAVVAEARRWARALDEGSPYRRLMEASRLWANRPDIDVFSDAAAAEGNLILTPCWFGGKIHVIEMDGLVYLGRGIRHGEPSYRKVAAEIATSLKSLADPTRLAILLRLAREPASVTEIARQFQLSQPTVSAHVQVLREAGLLEERTVGRSAELTASPEALRRLFSDAESSLLKLFRD